MQEKQVDQLLRRIEFLELLIDTYEETTDRLIQSNKMLLAYLRENYPKKSSTSL